MASQGGEGYSNKNRRIAVLLPPPKILAVVSGASHPAHGAWPPRGFFPGADLLNVTPKPRLSRCGLEIGPAKRKCPEAGILQCVASFLLLEKFSEWTEVEERA